jgi:hypothetical protein
VFNVDGYVGVNFGEGGEEFGLVSDIVADADRHEPPRRIGWPGIAPESDAGREFVRRVRRHSLERGVQDASNVDTGVITASFAAAWNTSGPR